MAKKNTATFLGPSNALVPIGRYFYAYAGEQTTVNAAPTTVFNFASPSQALRGTIVWTVDKRLQDYNKMIGLEIKFNGTTVMHTNGLSNWSDGGQIDLVEYNIIIPSRTTVEVIISTTDTQDIPMTVAIVTEIIDT